MLSQLGPRIPFPTSLAVLPADRHGQAVGTHPMVQAVHFFLPHRDLQTGSNMDEATRLAGVLQVLMPEAQDEEHRMTSEVLYSPNNSMSLQEHFKLLFYLLSNNFSLHPRNGLQPSHFSEREKDEDDLVLNVLRISGLNTLENMRQLFAMPGLTPRAIAEKIFGSAVRSSDLETLTAMLEAGMDPQTPVMPNFWGWGDAMTPLEYFCGIEPSVRMAKLLLSHNADVNAYRKSPCLLSALLKRNQDLIDMLLSHKANIDICLEQLESEAYRGDVLHALRPYLDRLLVHDKHNGKKGNWLATMLAISITEQSADWVGMLLAHDADVNSLHKVDFDGDSFNTTAVGLAAKTGNMEILQMLLRVNDPSDAQSSSDPNIIQPLTLAVDQGHADAILLLFNCGGDINTEDRCSGRRKTLFDRALEKEMLEICESLLQMGAVVEEYTLQHFYGERLCSLVAENDVDRILQLPLEQIDLDYQPISPYITSGRLDKQFDLAYQPISPYITSGRRDKMTNGTPLQIAIQTGCIQIIEILLNAGATYIGPSLDRIGNVRTAQYMNDVGLLPRVLNSSGQNLLGAAIDADDDTLVEYLLLHLSTAKLSQRRTWILNALDQGTGTPLEAAIKKGKLATMEALLCCGAPITDAELTAAVDRYLRLGDELTLGHIVTLRSPLRCKAPMALERALNVPSIAVNRALVEILLSSGLVLKGRGYSKVLERAAMVDDDDLFQKILVAAQWPKEALGAAFTASIWRGKRTRMQYLYDAGADLNQRVSNGSGHWFPLQIAVKNKDISLINALIDYGCHPDQSTKSHDGRTPLQMAAEDGDMEIVNLLLGAGADPDAVPIRRVNRVPIRRGMTALQLAVESGHVELMERLLDAGADVNSAPGWDSGATALQFAAIQGFIGIARRLLELGGDVNAGRAARYGRTALEGAAENGRLDMLQFLLANGALIDGRGRRQYIRAVKLAEGNGHSTIATFLRSHGQWTATDTQRADMEVDDCESDDESTQPDFENDLAWDYRIPRGSRTKSFF